MKIDDDALTNATKITVASEVEIPFARVSRRVLKRLEDLEVARNVNNITLPEIVRMEAVMEMRRHFAPFLEALNRAANPRHYSFTVFGTEMDQVTIEDKHFNVPVHVILECLASGQE